MANNVIRIYREVNFVGDLEQSLDIGVSWKSQSFSFMHGISIVL